MPSFQRVDAGEPLLSVEEAQERVLGSIPILGNETVELHDAHGRVLAEEVVAPHDIPEGDNSAMDGYAVRAADVASAPVSLRVVGDLPAGVVATMPIESGTAMRIMTGALLPPGADAVAQVEITDGGVDVVMIRESVNAGANVRRRGEDMRTGDRVLPAGIRLRAAELGVLAAAQKVRICVGRKPTVAIFATGDELVEPHEARTPGKVINSNVYALASLLHETGAEPRVLGIVRDDLAATIHALEEALASDFIVSSGGVSVGAYDFVKVALAELGAETKLWRVAMKPGKPFLMATLRERIVFGLPGNPVSSLVAFHLFVAPALRKAAGERGNLLPPVASVKLDAPLRMIGSRRTYFRARVVTRRGELVAIPMRAQGSGVSTSMVGANGLVIGEPGATLDAGAIVSALLVGPIFAE